MTPGRPPGPCPDWAYFLDIDGTLVPFAAAPGGVRPGDGLRRRIRELRAAAGGALALITGRSLADVDRLFPGIRVAAAGQHGLERRTVSGRVVQHAPPPRRLDDARRRLAAAAARHPGLLLEDKGLSLALHYRRAPGLAGYAHRLAHGEIRRLGARYGLRTGKRVVEIAPTGRDKGIAIAAFMAERPFRGRTPVFLGDDATDEFGFAVVNRLGGHTIKVGAGRSQARWRLRNVAAVRAWLLLHPDRR